MMLRDFCKIRSRAGHFAGQRDVLAFFNIGCGLQSNVDSPQKAQESQNRSFCVFVPFVSIRGSHPPSCLPSWTFVDSSFYDASRVFFKLRAFGATVCGRLHPQFLVTEFPWLISPFR